MINTPVLGLRSNVGTDPFLRDDFVFNWDLLDAAPGVATGTAAARSAITWAAGQAGRLYLETDTQRLMQWTGSAWVDCYQNAQSFISRIDSGGALATPGAGSSATYSFPSITLIRPSTLTGSIVIQSSCLMSMDIYMTYAAIVDITSVALVSAIVRRFHGATVGGSNDYFQTTVLFKTGLLSAGAHIPKVSVVADAINHGVNGHAIFQATATA
jgi:hypothetical protein